MLNNDRGGTKRTIEETVLNNLRGGTKRVVIVDGGGGSDPHNKGWFATSAALIAAYPTGADGDYAIVGDTDSIWLWDGDTNAWVNSGQAGQVSSVNGKTGTVVLTPADVNAVPQLAPLPTASATNVGMIAQYKGVTGATYTNGYFYKCVAKGTTPETYEWQKVRVQDGAFVAGTGIDITGDTISVTTAIKDGADLGATSLQPGNNVSELTNDAGYLTEHQTLADLGITATATELNVLDGITASTAELNYVDGVTSPIQTQINTNKTTMDNHIANTNNPHQVTKAQVGLGNVDNTSDLNKPVSTATQTALDGKQPKSNAAFSVGNATGGWTALSTAQQNALNSGANTTNIAQITTNQTAIATEKTARENADTALQDQIDALVSKSDVVDVVGTYAELQAYPTSTLHTNDVVKVISDSTHNAAPSYYRWVITGTTGAWTYIGSLADSYTKAETDTLLNAKQDNLTTAQLAAVNSGVTASTVSQVATNTTAIAGKQDTITDLATIRSGAALGATAVQPSGVSNSTITITQNGATKGTFTLNQATAGTVVLDSIDELTITKNSSSKMQAVATVNQNTATGATSRIYDWVGTLAQYTAQDIENQHPDWICFITDDESGYTSLLDSIYPVGSIYIGTQSNCPLASLISDSVWELVSEGRALWTGNGSNANTTIDAGLPNITGSLSIPSYNTGAQSAVSDGCFSTAQDGGNARSMGWADQFYQRSKSTIDASRSSSIYGKSSTVQPPAYIVNVWRRTA